MEWNLHTLAKSSSDVELTGICGGLGEHTPVPAWIWRVAFIALAFCGGAGLLLYGLLYVFMPDAQSASSDQ